MYYNFFEILHKNNINYIPPIKMKSSDFDNNVFWKKGISRLDKISQDYYGHPYGGILILIMNGKSSELEFKDNEKVIIPLPYKSRIEEYIQKVNQYIEQSV